MKIAIPVMQQRISPVLDDAARFVVVTCRRGKQVRSKEFVMAPARAEQLTACLKELGVNVLLCAAISESLMRWLERGGMRVHPHLCGQVEDIVRAFLRGHVNRPEFRMPGCLGRHVNGECVGIRECRHP